MGSPTEIHEGDDELAAFADELRPALVRPLPAAVEARQLSAIVAEAGRVAGARRVAAAAVAAPHRAARRSTRRRKLYVRLAPAALAALVASAGLAAAGVRPLDTAFEQVGIDLDEDPPAAESKEPARDRDPAGAGAGGGSGGAGATDRAGAKRKNAGDRRSETGERNSRPGRATADEVRENGGPPSSPGRSDEHAPAGTGPPADPPTEGGSAPSTAPGETRRVNPPRGNQDFGRTRGSGTAAQLRRAIGGGIPTP